LKLKVEKEEEDEEKEELPIEDFNKLYNSFHETKEAHRKQIIADILLKNRNKRLKRLHSPKILPKISTSSPHLPTPIDQPEIQYNYELFPNWLQSTVGLSKPGSPIDTNHRQRYYSILNNNNSIDDQMIMTIPSQTIENIRKKVFLTSDSNINNDKLENSFFDDLARDYLWSVKKSIFDYILKDPQQQKLLDITIKSKVCIL
jgi:hypothetical protein